MPKRKISKLRHKMTKDLRPSDLPPRPHGGKMLNYLIQSQSSAQIMEEFQDSLKRMRPDGSKF